MHEQTQADLKLTHRVTWVDLDLGRVSPKIARKLKGYFSDRWKKLTTTLTAKPVAERPLFHQVYMLEVKNIFCNKILEELVQIHLVFHLHRFFHSELNWGSFQEE